MNFDCYNVCSVTGFCLCDDPTQRQCPDRACIPEEWFCDGYSDCSMGEDEYNCRKFLQYTLIQCVRLLSSFQCDTTFVSISKIDTQSIPSEYIKIIKNTHFMAVFINSIVNSSFITSDLFLYSYL